MTRKVPPPFPFTAFVGLEQAKQALLVAALEPSVGGVLLMGPQGTGKSSLARSLAELLPSSRFVNLPLSVTEDRLVGSVDLEVVLQEKKVVFKPGLLKEAHGGVLYVDEVNLLPDHIVDVLLDVAASGINVVEREGLKTAHEARFVLIGSMNEAEGRLRPQLLDRFGLAVKVLPPADPEKRALAIKARIEYEEDPWVFCKRFEREQRKLRQLLSGYRRPELSQELLTRASMLVCEAGITSVRADLSLIKAAGALSYLRGSKSVEEQDLQAAFTLISAHRSVMPSTGQDRGSSKEGSLPQPSAGRGGQAAKSSNTLSSYREVCADEVSVALERPGSKPEASFTSAPRARGDKKPAGAGSLGGAPAALKQSGSELAVFDTALAHGVRLASQPSSGTLEPEDLRFVERGAREARSLVLLVDSSGSMAGKRCVAAAKSLVTSLLSDARASRDRMAIVAFKEGKAYVALTPTGSLELAGAALEEIVCGGPTPLGEGLRICAELIAQEMNAKRRPYLVVISDARASLARASSSPFEEALSEARQIKALGVEAYLMDPLGRRSQLFAALADCLGAKVLEAPPANGFAAVR